ncbi:TPA: restriction endonuclease subunit S [Klebsiella pneumoniae]|nr:restriction endonuclease subunit S [Klebsiella pneumoniae]
MSELSYLEKLLDGAEVEWKTLGSIAELKRGTSITKKDVIDGTIPVVAGGRTPAYYHNTSNRDGQTIVIAGSGAYAGFVSWWEEPIFVSDAFTVKPHNILLPRYCYHFLMNMQQQLHDFKSGGGVPHVYPRDVSPILIPIPCPDNPERSLAIQSEIVRILDKFTALTADLTTELTAELTMRKKQYNYYRDQLLSLEEDEIEWKALDDVCAFISAGGDVPENSVKGQVKPTNEYPYPIYANATDEKGLYGYTDSYKIDSDAVTISARGAKVGYHTVRDAKFTPIIRLIVLVANKNLVRTRYLNYVLDMTAIGGTDGGIPQLTVPMVKKITVPIPFASNPNRSLAEQDRIIAILDKFEILTNSISEGLQREINLRQKQYEYYRDLLLSFPKSNV